MDVTTGAKDTESYACKPDLNVRDLHGLGFAKWLAHVDGGSGALALYEDVFKREFDSPEQIIKIYAKDQMVEEAVDASFFVDASIAEQDQPLFKQWFSSIRQTASHEERKEHSAQDHIHRAVRRSPSPNRKRGTQKVVDREEYDIIPHSDIPDVRQDPDTGKIWSYSNFREKFLSEYDDVQIQKYWQVACIPVTEHFEQVSEDTLPLTKIVPNVSNMCGSDDRHVGSPAITEAIAQDEVRRDMASGRVWTFHEFRQHFISDYSELKIEKYWQVACEAVSVPKDVSQYVLNLVSSVIEAETLRVSAESEIRRDPTGKIWSLREFRKHYVSKYDDVQIKQYWQVACHILFDPDDLRVEPESGKSWTFRDFSNSFEGRGYCAADVAKYWKDACLPTVNQTGVQGPSEKVDHAVLPEVMSSSLQAAEVLDENRWSETIETPDVTQAFGQRILVDEDADEHCIKECSIADDMTREDHMVADQTRRDGYDEGKIPDEEVRRDPDSGRIWRFKDFQEHFEGSYSERDVCLYWTVACCPAVWRGDVSQYILNLISQVITAENSDAQEEESVNLVSSDSDASEIDEAEEGVDPEDASVITFGDVLYKYHGEYKDQDLRSWWRSHCRVGCDLGDDPFQVTESGMGTQETSPTVNEFSASLEASSDGVSV
eukprot:gnl/MRDRNA2_/MRDRNA2_107546_c0_seq1.p1 gnl/MRDRNA2_/MRDRNA2_107546_c0~~gnl/MRDRNA2_/MRDRNA2_107546_c0_seq1.p1  ORF type:complete len:659 (+),score=140.10 gnl/MRDRNA2_/MRDRNA2_107546_c0_seq1:95-2071(+)